MAAIEEDKNPQPTWHALGVEEAVERLKSDPSRGLEEKEAEKRREEHGPNEITGRGRKPALIRFLEHFRDPLIYILVIAGTVSVLIGKGIDGAVIYGVAFLNALIGFIQEAKAANAIAALAETVVTEIGVLRGGKKTKIPSREIVPGDVVLLASGDKVPADLRLFEARNLQTNESALTGESVPVEKTTEAAEEDAGIGDRSSMAFAGTLVTGGMGKGVAAATGTDTETGRISKMMEESRGLETPLTRKIRGFSKNLLYIILGLAGLTFLLTLLQGLGWIDGFQAAVALAVSAIPEGLPAVITVTLAIGVNRMAGRHAIIRKLPAVEALGSTTVICSDKTGTLTQNRMTVREVYAGGKTYEISEGFRLEGEVSLEGEKVSREEQTALDECLRAGLLCNDSRLRGEEGELETEGDPTEGALLISAAKAGLERERVEDDQPRIDTVPFASENQYMATLHGGDGRTIYLKGSLEAVLERCGEALGEDGKTGGLDREEIEEQAGRMAREGLRVLAFARKQPGGESERIEEEDLEGGMTFLGLQGMIDPPRPEALEAVKTARKAGIKVKMITGDHIETARAIAAEFGIAGDGDTRAYSGRELAEMSDEELSEAAGCSVFARVAPEHKLRLVEALQKQGEIVAVTGDGVNDAPALQQADIGVAMGIMGTEVAKEASDMVLTDDNFASIEAAVEEGRTVYTNLLKTIGFILPVNGGEALTILAGILLAARIPIIPVQILWINMISSVALMLTLSFEPRPKDIMDRPPRDPGERLLKPNLLVRVGVISLANLGVTFGMFYYLYRATDDLALARTVAVNTLVAAEAFYLLSISRFIPSAFEYLRDRSVKIAYIPAIGIAALVVLQYVFTSWGVMNTLFQTTPLTGLQALYCIAAGAAVLVPALILKKFSPIK